MFFAKKAKRHSMLPACPAILPSSWTETADGQQSGAFLIHGAFRQGGNFRKISEKCNELGISCLTVYAFSTGKLVAPCRRGQRDYGTSAPLFKGSLGKPYQKNVRLHVIGDRTNLPKDIVESIEEIHKMAEQCTGILVNLAINYGGRREIMQAAQKLAYDAVKGLIDPEKIDEAALESRLYTAGLPDPDLLIRTGSEQRISNFLLWQAAYAELYFTKVLWPSFGEADLLEAIAWFQARNRRFGGV